MDQIYNFSSLVKSGEKYPEIVSEIKKLAFDKIISPPDDLLTTKQRFNYQRNLYIKLSDGDDISWEEAKLGIKALPSISAPKEFYKNLKIIKMPEDIIQNAEKSRMYALSILNHPERINSLINKKKEEWIKPSLAHSRVLDKAEVEHKLLAFDDIAPLQPDLLSERLHRRKLLQDGPFSITSLKKDVGVRLPLATGSMVSGNPELIACAAMCGALATTYKEGLCIEPSTQAEVTTKAVEIIHDAIKYDPLWKDRKDKKILLNFWLNQIGITVSPDEPDAVRRIKLLIPLFNNGKIKSLAVRVYNPQVSKETVDVVKKLRKEYGNILEIFAGQANSVEAANRLVDAGADAVGVGIAGGLRCTTSIVSGIAVSVLRDLWRMRGKVNAPLFVDSSVSYFWSLAFLLGASMLVKPSHFVGIESISGRYPFKNGKDYYVPYNGEASIINKEHLGKLMRNGKPFAPEGVGGFAKIDLDHPTIACQVLDAIINFCLPPFVFQGTSSGRRFKSISDMHKESDLEFLWELSQNSQNIRGAWGPKFHIR
jgi:hypothetical protein